MMDTSPLRTRLVGLLMIGMLAGLFALAAAFYARVFVPTVPIVLVADRAGLVMDPGNDVKLRGVTVGRVTAITRDDGRTLLTLGLDPGMVGSIPANVTAEIVPTTVFGTKYVSLSEPPVPSTARIAADAVLRNDAVTVEVNNVFDDLAGLLRSIDPAKVSATLGEIAQALDGRGGDIATLADTTDTYLAKLNAKLPTLRRDLVAIGEVSQVYADVAPDVLTVLDNVTVTGNTLMERSNQLDAFLVDLTALGNVGRDVLGENQEQIVTALDVLRPTTGLLNEYSPMLTCFLQGLDEDRKLLEPVIGGASPEVRLNVAPAIGQDAYQNPRDLPKIGADNPPACYGLPTLSEAERPAPHIRTDTGADPNPNTGNGFTTSRAGLAQLMFGTSTSGGGGPR